jgi:triphosphoribosyl-dephospho-CoA synthase
MRAAHLVAASHVSSLAQATRNIHRAAMRSLWHELALYPKPGLVSLRDAGAHKDMNAGTFIRSLFALSRFFSEIADAGAHGAPFETLRTLGVRAEASMLAATQGINTHRGAIFVLGLLSAAVARTIARGETQADGVVRRTLLASWGAGLASTRENPDAPSNGMQAARRYGVAGARGEALRAFPSVFDVALPALRQAIARGCDERRACLSAFFALLAHVDDTNILHRGGAEGLAYVRRAAREFRDAGDVCANDAFGHAESIHREFIARRLSPGGCADLLAAALFIHDVQSMR